MKKYFISEIIDEIGMTKYTIGVFILVGLTLLFDGLDYMIVPFTMPQIGKEWALTKVQTGSLASWSLLGLGIGAIFAGMISDRIGRKRALGLACIVYSIFTLPIYFVQSYPVYSVLRVLAGVGLGACIPVAITMASELAPSKNRGLLSAGVLSFLMLGWALAGLVAIYVVPAFGWRVCYLIGGIPALYGIFILLQPAESPYWLIAHGREREAIKIVQNFEISGKGKARELEPGSLLIPLAAHSVGVKAIFSPDLIKATASFWLIYFFGALLIYGVISWLPSLLVAKGYGIVRSYSFSVAQNLFSVIGTMGTGMMADAIGRKKNMALGFFATAISIMLLGLSANQGQVLACSILVGILMNWGLSAVMPLMAETYRTEFRNTGIAWATAAGRAGAFCGPILGGVVQQLGLGFTGVFAFFTLPALICTLVTVTIVTETKGKGIEATLAASAKAGKM
ncbi:MAG TPA: MFS transporter [Syntrophobacteraceae bacterium]|nr:MFS transporter [Syntrophobacteraceae bacterium]